MRPSITYFPVVTFASGINSYAVYAKMGAWETGDFSERFEGTNLTPQILDQTPDYRHLINLLPSGTPSGGVPSGVFFPTGNGTYYFRIYSRNSLGIPALTPASTTVDVNSINPFEGFKLASLSLVGSSGEDSFVSTRGSGTYDAETIRVKWQAGYDGLSFNPLTDVKYRISIRKSTDPNAVTKATGALEVPVANDPFQPSSVIYYVKTGYAPSNPADLEYTFSSIDNVATFISYFTGQVSFIRDYDIVVEGHLTDGTSSAGGNCVTGLRNSVTDSDFSNPYGYDILYVNNPKVPAIELTTGDIAVCMTSLNPNKFCTEQWFNSEGEIKVNLKTGNLPLDTVGGFIYSCVENFTPSDAISGYNVNRIKVVKSEFTSLSNPIIATSDLKGYKSGFAAISFYDSLDKKFRTYINKNILPSWDGSEYLNVSNAVVISPRGNADIEPYTYRAWFNADIKIVNSGNYDKISWDYNSAGFKPIIYNGASVFGVTGRSIKARFLFDSGHEAVGNYILTTTGPVYQITDRTSLGFDAELGAKQNSTVFIGVLDNWKTAITQVLESNVAVV